MKGQYLAIESVLTLGLGLVLAVGIISVFDAYRTNLMATNHDAQIDIIESKIAGAVYTLDSADSGYVTVDIPERIGQEQYRIVFDDGIEITYSNSSHKSSLNNLRRDYRFTGNARGGPVKVFKKDDQYILRDE